MRPGVREGLNRMRGFIGVTLSCVVVIGLTAVFVVGWVLSRAAPARIGAPPSNLPAEAIEFPSGSGSMIRGWLSRGNAQRGVVLLLPGVRANRLSMVDRALFLRAAGYSTLLIDFQATGESRGDAITFGWRERLDVVAAVHILRQRFPGEPIGVIGTSLGGAATVLAAPDVNVQAAVLEAVYPSIDAAIENRLRIRFGRLAPALAPLLLAQLRPRLGVSRADLRPVDRIGLLRCPILVIGGAIDQHTTVADTQRLFAAASEPKELWLIPEVAHVDYLQARSADYQHRVLTFLKRALSRS